MLKGSSRASNRVKGIIVGIVVVVVVIVILASGALGMLSTALGTQPNPVVTRTQSGLVTSDSLITGNSKSWTFSAYSANETANYLHVENSSGLYLGAQSPKSGVWAGFYAVQPGNNAEVYHAALTLPYSTISNGSFNTGLYVQTTKHPVNYVSCGAGVNQQGYYWQVVVGVGDALQASNFQVLYFQWNNQSLTRDCTIITNGANLLTVYLGSTMVYSNSSMNLQMPAPFNVYLAVGTTSATRILHGVFRDYYATLGDTITVTKAPQGGTVKILDSSNNTITSVSVGANGEATIPMATYLAPQSGYIQVYYSTGKLMASTSSVTALWGGDTYSVT